MSQIPDNDTSEGDVEKTTTIGTPLQQQRVVSSAPTSSSSSSSSSFEPSSTTTPTTSSSSSQNQQQKQQRNKLLSLLLPSRSSRFSYCATIGFWSLVVFWIVSVGLFFWTQRNDGVFPIISKPSFFSSNNRFTSNNDNKREGIEKNNVDYYLRKYEPQFPIYQPPPFLAAADANNNNTMDYDPSILGEELLLTIPFSGIIRIKLRPDLSKGSVQYIQNLVQQQCARCYFHRKIHKLLLGTMANHNVPLNTEPGTCPSEILEERRLKQEKQQQEQQHQHQQQHDEDEDGEDGEENESNNSNNNGSTDKDEENEDEENEENDNNNNDDDNPNKCSVWNKQNCGCHGPILTKGMVGWVEGTIGGPEFFINLHESPLIDRGTSYTIFGQVDVDNDPDSMQVLESFLEVETSLLNSQVLNDKIVFDISLE